MKLAFPTGQYEVYADDDDVIGLTVAITKPSGYPIVRTDPPFMDAFDEFDVAHFLAWCLSQESLVREWQAATEQGEQL